MLALKERLQFLPDVAGIVHTAMVLRDEYIKDLTFQRFNEAMDPKIKGKTATNLTSQILPGLLFSAVVDSVLDVDMS